MRGSYSRRRIMTVTVLVERLKSITDLFFGFEAAGFALVCFITAVRFGKERRGWGCEFFGVVLAAFLGYYLHGYNMSPALHTGLWCLLYVIMFSITIGIYLLLIPHLGDESFVSDPETVFLKRAFPVLLIITEILCLLGVDWDIYGYALFALLLTVSLFRKTFKGGRKDARFILTVVLLALAAISQGFKFIFSEYAVVAAHIFLIAALALLFDFALHITSPSEAET